MGRRRSRVKKSPSVEARTETTGEASTNGARALRTLPSAASTQRLARSTSKITELLDHAHHHVELTMRICDGEVGDGSARSGDDDWPGMAGTAHSHGTNALICDEKNVVRKAAVLLKVLLRKSKRVAHLTCKPTGDSARYNRLKQGYESVKQHLYDTDAARKGLEDALASFRAHAVTMESVLPPEPRDSRVMMTSLHACFAQSAGLVDELLTVVTQDVASQTHAKTEQLASFQETLDRRDRLYQDAEIAKHELYKFQKLKVKQRSAIPGAYDLELAQRKHEYTVLRRRVTAMTAAMEHVFQFHSHLDQCIVDPEMTTTQLQLARFFEKHARVFEKNVK